MFESLESRRHLSVSVSLKAGVLTINGTNLADVITVNNMNSKTIAVGATSSDGTGFGSKTFKASAVKSIKVLCRGGSDYVYCGSLSSKVKLTLDGGAGDDILQGSLTVRTVIIGGAGKDVLSSGARGSTFEAANDGARDSIQYHRGDIVHADKTDSKALI
jgi:hypothetical protein